jgi:hypothetical protein
VFEGARIADFVPGVFHGYELTSADMQNYTLAIDAHVVYTGYLVCPWHDPRVSFGDETRGARSLSTWDYVRFGNVPEPSGGAAVGLGGALVAFVTRPRRRT